MRICRKTCYFIRLNVAPAIYRQYQHNVNVVLCVKFKELLLYLNFASCRAIDSERPAQKVKAFGWTDYYDLSAVSRNPQGTGPDVSNHFTALIFI
jgi:hypothetical protein